MVEAPQPGAAAWHRRRLVAVLAAGILAGVVFLLGLGLAIYYAIASMSNPRSSRPDSAPPAPVEGRSAPAGSARGQQYRDSLAAAPMLQVDAEDSRQGTPSPLAAPTIVIPVATATGPADVPTGFPRTPAGAVGQLAAIRTSVLQGMSIPQANEVYARWALPAGVGPAGWPMTKNVQSFLRAAGQGQSKDTTITVTATPAAGQIKGVDGDGWVLACALLDVQAVIKTDARIAYGYCERMQWISETNAAAGSTSGPGRAGGEGGAGGRWMIAPGPSPAAAPSTWAGTELAIKAGWRTWVQEQPTLGPVGGAGGD